MRNHPQRGKPCKITNGPLKGKYFIVIDFLEAQFQGKSIEKIKKTQGHLLQSMINRGFPVDTDVVFGKLYPEMNFAVVHDKELHADLRSVETGEGPVELPPNVEPITKKKAKTTNKLKSVKESPDDAS